MVRDRNEMMFSLRSKRREDVKPNAHSAPGVRLERRD
jgi:hypothetical protein